MAWSLGEDSHDWSHIGAIAGELAKGEGEYGVDVGVEGYDVVLNDGGEEEGEYEEWEVEGEVEEE